MMNSMTAFARAEKKTDNTAVNIEVRTYNSRYLDIVVRLPQQYLPLEEKIKSIISANVARGRVELKLQITDESREAVAFEVNRVKATAYHQALMQLRDELNIAAPIGLEQISGVGDIIKPVEVEQALDQTWQIIEPCLHQALADLNAMRAKEGAFIAGDIEKRINFISRSLQRIEQESTGLLDHYRDRLMARIAALTNGVTEIDRDRIAQEAAILADRSDITEETVRAASHLKQFRAIMRADAPAGRKLNFLLQELNREFNTIGSKTEKSLVSHVVVDVKSELEKIREQVQNIE
jgi:uncharacterized protein (TIGR00255 family)